MKGFVFWWMRLLNILITDEFFFHIVRWLDWLEKRANQFLLGIEIARKLNQWTMKLQRIVTTKMLQKTSDGTTTLTNSRLRPSITQVFNHIKLDSDLLKTALGGDNFQTWLQKLITSTTLESRIQLIFVMSDYSLFPTLFHSRKTFFTRWEFQPILLLFLVF